MVAQKATVIVSRDSRPDDSVRRVLPQRPDCYALGGHNGVCVQVAVGFLHVDLVTEDPLPGVCPVEVMNEVNESGKGMSVDYFGHGGNVDALIDGTAPLPIVGEVVREPKGRSSEP